MGGGDKKWDKCQTKRAREMNWRKVKRIWGKKVNVSKD